MKIAICDDREDDRGALKALLEAYGQDFEIREYGSGKSLCGDMDYIRKCGIVFLDINMDGMDGLDAARQIKAECAGGEPVGKREPEVAHQKEFRGREAVEQHTARLPQCRRAV